LYRDGFWWVPQRSLQAELRKRAMESEDDRLEREHGHHPNNPVSRSILEQIARRQEERYQADMIAMGAADCVPELVENPPTVTRQAPRDAADAAIAWTRGGDR
jgi:hypothetical protein